MLLQKYSLFILTGVVALYSFAYKISFTSFCRIGEFTKHKKITRKSKQIEWLVNEQKKRIKELDTS